MPYIVTATCTHVWVDMPRGEDDDGVCSATTTQRRAVAKLDGREVWNALYGVEIKCREEVVEMIAALPESGGTVGPLPGGTILEVKTAQWRTLCDLTAERYPGNDADRDRILAAFNARESA